MVDLDKLVVPLVMMDMEYVDELGAELMGTDADEVERFAISASLTTNIRAMTDTSLKSATFISSQKTVTVGPIQIKQVPEGAEVRFVVTNSYSVLLVSYTQNRLVLRNGIHRAYLLRRRGVTKAPCLLVREKEIQGTLALAYPAFVPSVLAQPRPPMLPDFFNPALSIELPLQKVRKIIKISAEESILPIE
jgi:hypothetical protein